MNALNLIQLNNSVFNNCNELNFILNLLNLLLVQFILVDCLRDIFPYFFVKR